MAEVSVPRAISIRTGRRRQPPRQRPTAAYPPLLPGRPPHRRPPRADHDSATTTPVETAPAAPQNHDAAQPAPTTAQHAAPCTTPAPTPARPHIEHHRDTTRTRANREMPNTSAGWLMMLLSGGTLSGAGMAAAQALTNGHCGRPGDRATAMNDPRRLLSYLLISGESVFCFWAPATPGIASRPSPEPPAQSLRHPVRPRSPITPRPLQPVTPQPGDTVAKMVHSAPRHRNFT